MEDRKGSLIFYNAHNVKVDPTSMEDQLTTHAPEWLEQLGEVSPPYRAMRRAARRGQRGLGNHDGSNGVTRSLTWREITSDSDSLVLGCQEATRDAGKEMLTEATVLRVRVEKKTGKVEFEYVGSGRIVAAYQVDRTEFLGARCADLLDRYRIEREKLTAEDMRKFMKTVVLSTLGGVSLTNSGASYFVPAPQDENLDALMAAVHGATSSISMTRVRLSDQMAVGDLAGPIESSIFAEIEALAKEAADWLEESREVDADGKCTSKKRRSSFTSRLDKVDEIEAQVKAYESLLGRSMTKLTDTARMASELFEEAQTAVLASR